MALQPWYKVIIPREDLRDGKPLDASEFAVHLDHVRDGRAPADYQNPQRFFGRTYLTKNLVDLAAQVVRRLSGIRTETSAVFNMTTQFGGGKTHALTLLYHLARGGPEATAWAGVDGILAKAGVSGVPVAATAVFVGTEFDAISGRGGKDGTPLRKTPWGEIAWQLGGAEAFAIVAEHDKQLTAPSGDVIRRLLPADKPCLILMDELMNFVSRFRKSGLASQLYNFLHNLSETVRGQDNTVLVASIPASELEMNAEDQSDYDRFKKMLDRLGKAVIMSSEGEASEIIRRRLFEWDGLTKEAEKTIAQYVDWVTENKTQIGDFPVDHAREAFRAAYPFHPTVLSVFERKWQALPRFQQTRGVLRLLALWVSRAYQDGYKGGHKDPLIGLGTAPLDESLFRTAMFEQLGEPRLEGAVTTDICGKRDSHAQWLDHEADEEIKKARLHTKVATAIFFESNGGMARHEATVPEIRLAVGEPGLDIGNVETVLEALGQSCYYLSIDKNRYRFSLSPNLNKLLSDRRASIQGPQIDERVKAEIQKIFAAGTGAERIYFPEKSSQVPDRPVLTLAVIGMDRTLADDAATRQFLSALTREYGKSARTFKSAVIWVVADSAQLLREEARTALAWEDIREQDASRLDEAQQRQLDEHIRRAKRDVSETVWRSYKNVLLLDKVNELRTVDLGLITSSQAADMLTVIIKRLREEGDLERDISPNFLVRNWPAMTEWSTKAVRDAFFSSPQLPRLMNGDVIKDTIARGVRDGILAYVGQKPDGHYEPFIFGKEMSATDVEISEDMFVIRGEEAKKHIEPPRLAKLMITPARVAAEPDQQVVLRVQGIDQFGRNMDVATETVAWTASGGTISAGSFTAGALEGAFSVQAQVGGLAAEAQITVSKPGTLPLMKTTAAKQMGFRWSGEVPPQKWMNFYTKVLSRHVTEGGLKLTVNIEANPDGGISEQRLEEARAALRELGLSDQIDAQ
jgi:hypothetical protein